MTIAELQAKRDGILKGIGVARIQSADRSLEYVADKQRELALVDSEIAKLQSPSDRQFVIQTKRGI